jgi:hypothetical protein
MHRYPRLAFVFAAAVLLLHFAFCYQGMTRRGYPPIHPFWDGMALYVCLSGIVFFPFFDDRPATRHLLRNIFLTLYCFIATIAKANINGPRPSIGHLAGVEGVLRYHGGMCIVGTVESMIMLYLPVWWLEVLAVDFWRRLRRFPDGASTFYTGLDTRLPVLIPAWCLIVVVSCVWAFADERKAIRQNAWMHNQAKLPGVANALSAYHQDHACFPYDDRGPDYALYALHDLLEASDFAQENDDGTTPAAFWDHEEHRLHGGEALYLNQADVREAKRVILVFPPKPGKQTIHMILADCFWDSSDLASPTHEALLGSIRKD